MSKRSLNTQESFSGSGSQIFRPYRALGSITDKLPVTLVHFDTESFAITSIGKSWQMYNCDKLNLLFVGTPLEKKIRAIAAYKKKVITASGNIIHIWKRGKIIGKCEGHKARVEHLLVLGDFLISVDVSGVLYIWVLDQLRVNKKDKENPKLHTEIGTISPHSQITIPIESLGEITTVMHPHTYLNKILIGTKNGSLHLWNIKTQKLIYSFPGWGSAVTCIEQSTAVDVVAVGLANGAIVVHNLKFDKTVVTFKTEVEITSLSFHTKGEPILLSSNQRGEVATWNLETQMLENVQKAMHEGTITSVQFIPNQPLFVTSGTDNALKMWVFGEVESEFGKASRLLRMRSSHSDHPSIVRFYGETGTNLLTCGATRKDPSFRFTSTILDHLSRELSQGNIVSKSNKLKIAASKLKLPPIIQFDTAPLKELEWDNIVTCHLNHNKAFVWSFMKLAKGKHSFKSTDPHHQRSQITSVAMSSCGNYAFIANIYGHIDKFNIQSGIHRGSCSVITEDKRETEKMRIKKGSFAIKGMVVDILNLHLIVCSASGDLVFFDLKTLKEKRREKIDLGGISFIRLQKESSMLAIVGENLTVQLFDIDAMRIVRKFTGHTSTINDLTFSSDARWLVTCSNDRTIRVWDIVSGAMIDWMETPAIAKSVSFSPKGDFFATTHIGSRHVYLWSNLAHFSHLYLKPIDLKKQSRPTRVMMPSATHDQHVEAEISAAPEGLLPNPEKDAPIPKAHEDAKENENVTEAERETKRRRIDDGKITFESISLSDAPRQAVLSIANIELIKERNKPTMPAKKPESAPFILPTMEGFGTPRFVVPEKKDGDDSESTSIMSSFASSNVSTQLMDKIKRGNLTSNYREVIEYIQSISPSALDFDIRMMSINNSPNSLGGVLRPIGLDDNSIQTDDIDAFFQFVEYEIPRQVNYELLQALLGLVLQVHGEVIMQRDGLRERLDALKFHNRHMWVHLQTLFHHSLSLINHFSGIQS